MKNTVLTPNEKAIEKAVDYFLEQSKPYHDALSRIESLKPCKYLFDIKTSDVKIIKSQDTETEIQIKAIIQKIYDDCFKDINHDPNA